MRAIVEKDYRACAQRLAWLPYLEDERNLGLIFRNKGITTITLKINDK
jgi:hypothetical protein